MTDQVPTEESGRQYEIGIEHFDVLDQNFSAGLLNILSNAGLANVIINGVRSRLSDPNLWRLTISGDVVASVNAIENRETDDSYTVRRGVGEVGARTINLPDGTYQIVIGASSLMPAYEVSSPRELIDYMHSMASHLAIHESGHILLHQRGEDAKAFQDLAVGSATERAWRKHLARHIDDFRIEKMANRTDPSPASNIESIGDTLVYVRNELTESNQLRLMDGEAATFRSSTAVNDLLRVMTYLSAELGAGLKIELGMRPDPLPNDWPQYLEDVWDAWALSLDRLKPADEPMPAKELAAVLTDLCKIVVVWSKQIIGYHFEMHDDGSWTAIWYRDTY